MTRLSKFPAKIALSFCTLFCLWPCFAFSDDVDTAWVRRYNGPGNGDDKAVAIAVDSSGNVYVTGSSFDSTTGYDYCTIKYLPNGDTGWVRRYDGPGRPDGLEGQNDFAVALASDKEGNVYVTGTAATPLCLGGYGSSDIVTIKYLPNGETGWVRSTSAPFCDRADLSALGLAMDSRSNLYIAGQGFHPLYGWYGFALKYDSAGNDIWGASRWFSEPSNVLSPIAVNSTGSNVCIIDYDGIFKYDSLGNEVWAESFPARSRSVAVDNNGNTFVVGADDSNFVVIKYDPSGDSLWVRRSNSRSEEWQGASFVAADKQNNIYVVGNYASIPDDVAWTATKYDSMGNQFWYRAYRGINFGQLREPRAMVLDTTGNLYVTGYDAWFAATLKYDPQGNLRWEKKFGDANHPAEMRGIGIDQKGNVFVAGFSQSDFLTIKYSPLPQLKGDLNLDGVLGLQDVIYAVNYTFMGELPPAAPSACDINCDVKITPADVVVLLLMVFAEIPAPC